MLGEPPCHLVHFLADDTYVRRHAVDLGLAGEQKVPLPLLGREFGHNRPPFQKHVLTDRACTRPLGRKVVNQWLSRWHREEAMDGRNVIPRWWSSSFAQPPNVT